jgi:hypothetical protein
MHGVITKAEQIYSKNTKELDKFGELGVDGRIKLKLPSEK